MLEQDRAIVTDVPGTTRDLVSETAVIEGIPVRFVDTAGIRAGQDVVEKLGIERSYQAMADADLTVVVVDLSAPLDAADVQLIEKAQQQGKSLIAGNKCDLAARAEVAGALRVSALTGEGLTELRRAIIDAIAPRGRLEQEGGFITSLRHEQLLQETRERPGAGANRDNARASRMRCCCWICTRRCVPSTASRARLPRMIF